MRKAEADPVPDISNPTPSDRCSALRPEAYAERPGPRFEAYAARAGYLFGRSGEAAIGAQTRPIEGWGAGADGPNPPLSEGAFTEPGARQTWVVPSFLGYGPAGRQGRRSGSAIICVDREQPFAGALAWPWRFSGADSHTITLRRRDGGGGAPRRRSRRSSRQKNTAAGVKPAADLCRQKRASGRPPASYFVARPAAARAASVCGLPSDSVWPSGKLISAALARASPSRAR